MSTFSADEKAFIRLLNGLEDGSVPLNRSKLVKKGLALIATPLSENVMVDVEKKIAMTPPPEALLSPPSLAATKNAHQNGDGGADGAAVDNADGDEGASAAAAEQQQQVHIDTMTTISSSCVVEIRSRLSDLFDRIVASPTTDTSEGDSAVATATTAVAANNNAGNNNGGKNNNKKGKGKGGKNNNNSNNAASLAAAAEAEVASPLVVPTTPSATPLRISSAKHRLLLYRFLLNGLADMSGERQLLMAAAPMFAMEAEENHKKIHSRAIEAILNGILLSGNDALKAALKLTAEAGEDKAPKERESEETTAAGGDNTSSVDLAFAKNIILGLVLYFEQKTGTAVFTVRSDAVSSSPAEDAAGASSSSSSSSPSALPATIPKSTQGRFFDLVTVLTCVIAEGLSTQNETISAEGTACLMKDGDGEEDSGPAAPSSASATAEGEEKEEEAKASEDAGVAATEEPADVVSPAAPASPSSPTSNGGGAKAVEAVFLSTLFTLLYRLVPIFLPLRGDETLFAGSALPDLLRLLLQYHDPILSMHVDQHPPLRRRPATDDTEEVKADGALTEGKEIRSVSAVAPARTMADAAYHYLTGVGCSTILLSSSVAAAAAKVSSSSDAPSIFNATITSEQLSLLDLIMLRYDDSYYFGCLSFVATVLLHRGHILKLKDGEAIAKFWSEFASGEFGNVSNLSVSIEPIKEVEAEREKLEQQQNKKSSDEANGDGREVSASSVSTVKQFSAAVLAFQSRAGHMERLPPVLEPLAGLLFFAKTPSSSSPNFAALVAVLVRNLAKNTPTSAKVFATAILSATNKASSSGGGGGMDSNSVSSALGALAMGGSGGSTISETIERQRVYVASFPVMPVTAEELVLVFPAGGPSPAANTTTDSTVASARAPPSGGDPSHVYSSSHLQYLVLDSRAENSFLFARLPTAIHIGSGIGFDTRQLAATVFQLQDAWSSHLTIMGTGRSIVEELNLLKLIAMRLVEKGFPNVSIVDGGFKACIPYLKAGQMEFVQSPQSVRDECAARDAAIAASKNALLRQQQQEQQQQHHVDPHNTSRSTLNSTEEIAGEIASQAEVIKENVAVLKDKAAEGLKKTGENISEVASSAASWGASVWGRLSTTVATGVASTKEKLQKTREEHQHHQHASSAEAHEPNTANNSQQQPRPSSSSATASSSVSGTASSAPTTAVTADPDAVPSKAPTVQEIEAAAAGFFSNLVSKVKESAVAVGHGAAEAATAIKPNHAAAAAPHQAAEARAEYEEPRGPAVFVNGDDDEDDDDDLGLITTVAPATVVPPPPAAAAAAPATVGEVPPSPAVVPAATPPAVPAVAAAAAPAEEVVVKDQQPATPVKAAPPAASKPSATSVIDDLFGDVLSATPAGAASPAATEPAATTVAKPATTVSSSVPKAPSKTTTAFDDIFGDDF